MALKTDYKDAMFDGQRRYRLIANEDGTYSLPDETKYTQSGDKFGANDINATNTEINKLETYRTVTLLAGNWGGTPPYTQTVNVSGITAADNPVVSLHIPDGSSAANVKAWNKAFGMIDEGITINGQMTFKCYNKKPATNITVAIKGV